jgi:hypothetical protein
MLLRAIAIRHDRLEPSTIVASDLDFDPRAHVGRVAWPIPNWDSYVCADALVQRRIRLIPLSLPGLARQSTLEPTPALWVDARIKSGHDKQGVFRLRRCTRGSRAPACSQVGRSKERSPPRARVISERKAYAQACAVDSRPAELTSCLVY